MAVAVLSADKIILLAMQISELLVLVTESMFPTGRISGAQFVTMITCAASLG